MNLDALPSHLQPPDDFVPAQSHGGFSHHNDPLFVSKAPDDLRSGLFVLEHHCNSMGFLHGGMASAFADRALAVTVWYASGRASVTLKLSLHFYTTVRLHDWLEAHPQILHMDTSLVQVSADLKINGARPAARADATFRLLRRGKTQT